MFFLLEAVLWMQPLVYNILLGYLDNKVSSAFALQAMTLKNLFINQGFYNFFIMCAGLEGVYLVHKDKFTSGFVLILFMCFCGSGAGVVLACSTKAYLLALIQGVPAAIAFLLLYLVYKKMLYSQRSVL